MDGKWSGAGGGEMGGWMPLGAVRDCMVYLALCEREGYVRF